MTPKEELLQLVEAAIAERGLSASRFGDLAARDRNLVFQMRKGRELRHHTAARVIAFIEEKRAS